MWGKRTFLILSVSVTLILSAVSSHSLLDNTTTVKTTSLQTSLAPPIYEARMASTTTTSTVPPSPPTSARTGTLRSKARVTTTGPTMARRYAIKSASLGRDWPATAECESHSMWDLNSGNGYYGGLQFSASTWRRAASLMIQDGSWQYGEVGLPHLHPAAVQIAVADDWLDRPGITWQTQWPRCGRGNLTG